MTSSATSNYVGTLASEGIATYSTLNGQSHSVCSDHVDGSRTFHGTMIDDILATEFYGVPVDVIRALIREHLPEYTL